MNPFIRSQLARVQRMYDRWMEKRAGKVSFPDTVEVFEDLPYLDTGMDCHKLDIYRPKSASGKLPVIVDLHGGGLLLCSRKTNRLLCGELASRGFLVFCLGYPLVPEAEVPRILGDVAAGMDKVAAMLEAWGGDRDRVFLVGDSAGAFLSVYALAAQKDAKIAASLGLNASVLPVKAAAFLSGMFYTAEPDQVGAYLRRDFYGKGWRKHPFRAYMDPACPAVAGAMPRCILVTSKLDHLRGYTMRFVRGLQNAGVGHRLEDMPLDLKLTHDFVIVEPEHPVSQQVIKDICGFLLMQQQDQK